MLSSPLSSQFILLLIELQSGRPIGSEIYKGADLANRISYMNLILRGTAAAYSMRDGKNFTWCNTRCMHKLLLVDTSYDQKRETGP